jgi:hypothetical protein
MKALLDLLRKNKLFFLLVTLAALALRLFFVLRFPHIEGDAFIYGDIAKNWLNHGIYGLATPSVQPTLIRLPGYPAFLALMFSIFGQEHYRAVMTVQAFIDTNTCLVIAALALEIMNTRGAKAAYLLAALCPFTASYAATPMSETLAIFTTAHALYYGIRGLKALDRGAPATLLWITSGVWTSAAIYMRPDACLLMAPFSAALLYLLFRRPSLRYKILLAEALLLLSACAPLVPWTLRNWRTFHVFQPLAPRYANDPGEFVPMGFNHWVKTWLVDFVSVDEVFWHVPVDPIDPASLPQRAFDSRAEYEQTQAAINTYNQQLNIGRDLDASFDSLARSRIEGHRFRYYIWLPALRIADMWLRPRTEMMDIELRWWEFSEHTEESIFALAWAALNFFFLTAAVAGWLRWRLGLYGLALVGYVLLRSAFLGTLENPEPRYMLECFPVILALAGGAFARRSTLSSQDTII